MEVFGNGSGSADKSATRKLCYQAGFYIYLFTIHFYDLLAKYQSCKCLTALIRVEIFGTKIRQLQQEMQPRSKGTKASKAINTTKGATAT